MKELTPQGREMYARSTNMPEDINISQGNPSGEGLPHQENEAPESPPPNVGGEGGSVGERPIAEGSGGEDAPRSSGQQISVQDFRNPAARALFLDVEKNKDFYTERYRSEVFDMLRGLNRSGRLTQTEGDMIRGLLNVSAAYDVSEQEAARMAIDRDNFIAQAQMPREVRQFFSSQEEADAAIRETASRGAEENVRARRRARNKEHEVREAGITSKSLIPNYLNAIKAVDGDVDAVGKLLHKGFDSVERLKNRLQVLSYDTVQELMERLQDSEGRDGDIGDFLLMAGILRGKDFLSEMEELSTETTDQGYRKKLKQILNSAENFLAIRTMNERGFNSPSSIQDIAWDIAATDKEDFRFGGKYAIFKRINEGEGKGDVLKFQPDSFIAWGRSKMMAWDDENPDDPQEMTKIISVFGAIRGVGLGEMMLTAGFFRDEDSDTGETFDDLKIKLIYEAWPFGTMRNDDIAYKAVSGSDDDVAPKALIPILDKNTVTKPNVLNNFFTLTDVGEVFNPTAKNTKTGRALRRAFLAYYYLPDEKMLDKNLKQAGAGELALFNNEAFFKQYIKAQMYKNNIEFDWDKGISEEADGIKGFLLKYSDILFRRRNGDVLSSEDIAYLKEVDVEAEKKNGKYKDESPLGKAKSYVDKFIDLTKPTSSLFDARGVLKGQQKKEELLRRLNFFNNAMPSVEQINETRERIRMSIMQSEDVDADTAEYVERLVYRMTRWGGIAARNDLDSVGHDAWSKVINTSSYLQHQSIKRRIGASGNKFAMGQFKRLGVDLFSGIQDASGKSILEFIQGGQGEEMDLSKPANTMSFPENTAKHFGADHINRVFQVFHRHAESKVLKLNEIIKVDDRGRAHVSEEKISEAFKDSFLKEMRYPWATWTGIDFTEEVRMWVEKYDDEGNPIRDSEGNPIREFKSRPLARHMFGDEMFKNNGEYDYSSMLKYEEIKPPMHEEAEPSEYRLKIKKYYQLEKKLNELTRNQDAAKERDSDVSRGLAKMSLEERIRLDTEGALTDSEKEFLIKEREWYKEVDAGHKAIVKKMVDTFTGSGRGFFWKEAAKVMIASEIKEARKWVGSTQELYMTAEACDKLYRILSQMGANNVWSEDDLGSARYAQKAWSRRDIKDIQKMSGTQPWWTTSMELLQDGAYGGIVGIWQALVYFFSTITK